MSDRRTLCWVSAGAASAVASKLALAGGEVTLVYCDTGAEHEDNARFLTDLEKWFGQPIERIKSEEYDDTWAVWEDRKYIAGIAGAPCTSELKVKPRLGFQRPTDIHVFGYTADLKDMLRARHLKENYPELQIEVPLIERGLDKAACLAMLERAGLRVPLTYALGLPNANCLPCPKATSPAYWALIRKEFPDRFERMAKLSRKLGARLARVNDERVFIDEVPANQSTTDAIVPSCDFLCAIAEQDMESAA